MPHGYGDKHGLTRAKFSITDSAQAFYRQGTKHGRQNDKPEMFRIRVIAR